MTTEPTDLRERIARALSEHWRDMHTNEALGQQRMLAAAVLPIVREAQAEAWDEGEKAGYVHGQCDTNRLDPGPEYAETPNPYTEESTDDE